MKLDCSMAIFYCFNSEYYELEIFQDGDKPHYSTRDRPLYKMRARISLFKFLLLIIPLQDQKRQKQVSHKERL